LLLLLIVLGRDYPHEVVGILHLAKVNAELLNVDYHVCVEVNDFGLDQALQEQGNDSHHSRLSHRLLLLVSTFAHLLV
jgi:hypothetical protein